MNCAKCQTANPDENKFCRECGAKLSSICPQCGAELITGDKFCGKCGQALREPAETPLLDYATPKAYTPKHLADKILTDRSAIEGERKLVTVLFCDLVESTALAERLGPEAMHAVINRFFGLSLDEIHLYEGTINQFLGDGFMALFGAPIAHEDHARRATLAALGVRHRIREYRDELTTKYDLSWSVRMGLHTGWVVVGGIGDNLRMDYTAVGDTTHLAARLEQAADPDTILISDATSRLVQGYLRVESMEDPLSIKGKAEPVQAFRVLGVGPRRSPLAGLDHRALSPFVGRDRELSVLAEVLEHVERGQGQVVGVVGEPGVGKSRLVYEFRYGLRNQRVTYLEGRCLSYGSAIPYNPIVQIIRHNCGIVDADGPDAIAAKVSHSLQEVGMDPEESAPYLFHLLGLKRAAEQLAVLSPEAVRDRTFGALRQMCLNGSRRQPLVIEVEDLHWIDKTSEAFLASLVESLPGVPILLLLTYRPGYRPPWMDKSYATQIALHSLAPEEGLVLVHATLRREALPDHLAEIILNKAEGNPFFLEELTREVVEHGGAQADLAVPDTVQGVIMARIDRLPEEPKRALQTASVLGREFSPKLLEAIWDAPSPTEPLLQELKRLEFLFERTGTGEPVCVFKHALTQDVAYESLLTSRRQTLHAAAGRALEALYADRLEEAYDRLAYHYARTYHATKAVEYLTLVAEKAARGYAHAETVKILGDAMAHAERLPAEKQDRSVLDVAIRCAESLFFLGRREEAVEILLGRKGRLERVQDPLLSAGYYVWLTMSYSYLGKREHAVQSARRAFGEAQEIQDESVMGLALGVLGLEEFFSGRLLEAVDHVQQSVALLEKTDDRFGLGGFSNLLGYCYYFIGEFELALDATSRGQDIARRIGDRRLQSQAESLRGWFLATRGEWVAGIDACRRGLEDSPDAYECAISRGLLGHAYLEKGDLATAIPIMEQALEEANLYRSHQVQCWFKAYLAEAHQRNSEIEKARDLAVQGLEQARNIGHPWGVGLAQRVLGRVAQSMGNLSEAQALFEEALGAFTSSHARFEQARTHLDLAGLDITRGDRDAAANHVAEAHALFTALRVPKWIERAEQLAVECGVSLPVVTDG